MCLPFKIIRVSEFLLASNLNPSRCHRPCPQGMWEMATPLQLAAASRPWFQTASVKRIVNSKHMRCHEASHPLRHSTLGPVSGWAWNTSHSEPSPIIHRVIKTDQSFSFTPVPELSSDWIPFPKYILGLILCVIKDRAYLHLSCQEPENKISHMGKFGHPLWFFTNSKNVAWQFFCKHIWV